MKKTLKSSDMNKNKTTFMIGSVPVSGRVALAPMAGVTDIVFRQIARRSGAAFTVSEMIATKELTKKSAETLLKAELSGNNPQDVPHVVQIAGCDPHNMAHVAKIAETMGAHIVDINMGCPSKNVVGGYAGAALMKDLKIAAQIIEHIVKSVRIPVTLKMRLGWDETSINADQLAYIAEDLGIQCIVLHGRTRNQKYKGTADWHMIGTLMQAIKIPIIANGDIIDTQSARDCLTITKADGLMVGRAAIGRPWLPGQIHKSLESGIEISISIQNKIKILAELYEGTLSLYGKDIGVRHMRKHFAAFIFDLNRSGYELNEKEKTTLLSGECLELVKQVFYAIPERAVRIA